MLVPKKVLEVRKNNKHTWFLFKQPFSLELFKVLLGQHSPQTQTSAGFYTPNVLPSPNEKCQIKASSFLHLPNKLQWKACHTGSQQPISESHAHILNSNTSNRSDSYTAERAFAPRKCSRTARRWSSVCCGHFSDLPATVNTYT